MRGWNAKYTNTVRDDVAGYLLMFFFDFIAGQDLTWNFFSMSDCTLIYTVIKWLQGDGGGRVHYILLSDQQTTVVANGF
jgi:hypothetical protein